MAEIDLQIAFVTARLDEDEAEYPRTSSHRCYGDIWIPAYENDEGRMVPNKYLCRHQREVEAKRKILDWCTEVIGDRDLADYGKPGCLSDDRDALAVTLAVETIRHMATVYSSHPDYQPQWRAEVT